jgi:spore maturation protein CgeB
VLSDAWPGLDEFFTPGSEILVARTSDESIEATRTDDAELGRIGRAARERALTDHTAVRRAGELVALLEGALAVGA